MLTTLATWLIVGVPGCVQHGYIGAYHDIVIMHCPLFIEHMLVWVVVMHVHYVALVIVTVPANLPRRPFIRAGTRYGPWTRVLEHVFRVLLKGLSLLL